MFLSGRAACRSRTPGTGGVRAAPRAVVPRGTFAEGTKDTHGGFSQVFCGVQRHSRSPSAVSRASVIVFLPGPSGRRLYPPSQF